MLSCISRIVESQVNASHSGTNVFFFLQKLAIDNELAKQEDLPETEVVQEHFVPTDKNKEPEISHVVSKTAHKTRSKSVTSIPRVY